MRISDWSSDVCSSDLIILDPEASPAWWAELKTTNRLDPAFQHHALMVAESYRQFMDKPLGDDEVRVRFSAQPYIVSAEKAGQLIQQSQLMASYSDHNPPFEFKSGRGGRLEEHTSELQSLMRISYAVFCLKKKNNTKAYR